MTQSEIDALFEDLLYRAELWALVERLPGVGDRDVVDAIKAREEALGIEWGEPCAPPEEGR